MRASVRRFPVAVGSPRILVTTDDDYGQVLLPDTPAVRGFLAWVFSDYDLADPDDLLAAPGGTP